jgi:C1A family cysteine protease
VRYYGRKDGISRHFSLRPFEPEAKTSLPVSVSYESYAPPVFNQGAYGTCVANATASVQMLYAKKRGRAVGTISRSAIYSQAKHSYEPTDIADDGLMVTDGLLVPKNFGYVIEPDWPYPSDPSGRNTGDLLLPVPATLWNVSFEEASYLAVDTSSVETMMRALDAHGPCIIGLSFALEWEGIGPDGFMNPAIAKTAAGGHCIYILGFDRNHFGGAFRIRNSWGPEWGANGDGWLPFDALTTCPSFWPSECYTVSFPPSAAAVGAS